MTINKLTTYSPLRNAVVIITLKLAVIYIILKE